MHHVIIIGSRGYIKKYGGWETLIHGMIDNWIDQNTKFYVIEVSTEPNEPEFEKIDKIECIRVRTRLKGSLQMLEANAKAIQQLPKYIKKFHMLNPILYVLGPRVGFFFFLKLPMLKRNRVAVVKNTDGIEWKRDKYGFFRRLYILIDGFFFDRFVMDYLVADAKEMLRIYKDKLDSRKKPCDMRVIYYGTNKTNSLNGPIPDNVKSFFERYSIKFDNYYLIINRLLPENSYEMILKEFLKSDTICDLIVVTNQDKEKAFFNILKSKIPFEQDNRIKFVGTVYDKEILSWLRQKARGYINGHTMGGTNPGLLEGLATTNVNLVRDCPFSREGADDTAFYFDENHPMSELIAKVDAMPMEERIEIGIRAKKRMSEQFSWSQVNEKYIELFNDIQKDRVEKA